MKEEILKKLFLLPKEDILDILKILQGFEHRLNKSKNDSLLARCMFASGYHSTKEYQKMKGITKDHSLSVALTDKIINISTLNELRKDFNIDNEMIIKIISEGEV